MIAILSPIEFWFGDPPVLNATPSSDTQSRDRRMTRSPTLDGGAVVNDGGWSEADRTFTLVISHLSEADADTLREIAATTSQTLALPHGLYSGYVKSHVLKGAAESQFTFWVAAKLA